jgi:hypothetical protein
LLKFYQKLQISPLLELELIHIFCFGIIYGHIPARTGIIG